MHIHVLGVCGTFMGGLAQLARQLGHTVTGSDAHIYPPMSTQLAAASIDVLDGYAPAHLDPPPERVVVGNVLSRGNPAVEYMLDRGLCYTSGPQWLAEEVLRDRWVVAVAGTHGKTTTASMVAWILEDAGLEPGFLIGGVPQNFGVSARLGGSPLFVIEADEYDTAFFDKRSKFIHYRPRTLIANNLEYDHADIFPDLEAIKRQFHHLIRTVPGNGRILVPADDANLEDVLARGCWTPVERVGGEGTWQARLQSADGARFAVLRNGRELGEIAWALSGRHNVHNALAAIAGAVHAGVPPAVAVQALTRFGGVKRRLELRGTVRGVSVYDDFAHHPTAVATTLEGLRRRVGSARIVAILEPRSNTMRLGGHRDALVPALAMADEVILYQPSDLGWDLREVAQPLGAKAQVFQSLDVLIAQVAQSARGGEHVLVMSNGAFGDIHERLLRALADGA